MKKLNKNIIGLQIASTLLKPTLYGDGEGDSGESVGGQGSNTGIDINSPEFQSALQSAIAKETDGLKRKNSELLDNNKQLKDQMKNFDGLDADKVRNMMKVFAQNEEAQLIADGKFDEVMQKRTDSLKEQFNDQIKTLQNQLEISQKNESAYKTRLDQNTIRQDLTDKALKAGVRKDAIDDVVRRGFDIFSVNEKGETEARNENGELIQNEDGLLLNTERFVQGLQRTHPYYWGESVGGGSNGAGAGSSGKNADQRVADLAKSGNIDLEAYRKARKAQSGDNYHR